MNIINFRTGAGIQPLGYRAAPVNPTSKLDRDDTQSTSTKNVLDSLNAKKAQRPNTDNEALSNQEKTHSNPFNESLVATVKIDQNIPPNATLFNEPQLIKNQTAVANYQLIGNIAKRESVQQMLGIDLFA
ncbi:MAG: hypothetical protein ACPGTQ_07125 [Colwellia sp.]